MEPNQESKKQDIPQNNNVQEIYVGPFKGKWCVSEYPDIFGEPFYTKKQAIAEAQSVKNQKPNSVLKIFNEETKEYEVMSF